MRRRRSGKRAGIAALLPMSAFLQRGGDLRRHVFLVVLGEDRVRDENTVRNAAFGDDPLPFTEKVRKNAIIADGDICLPVGDAKRDLLAILMHDALGLDETADAHPSASQSRLRGELGGAVKEDEVVAKR